MLFIYAFLKVKKNILKILIIRIINYLKDKKVIITF